MDEKIKQRIENVLHGDESKFGHLFPHRKSIPKIDKHVFTDITKSDLTIDKFVVNTMMDIRYIGWTAKVLLNVDLFPMQIAILQTMWHKPFPMFIASRGAGKSFLLAVYSVLKSLLDPGVKIVIVGAGFRQAKLVFDYVINTWKSAPVLQDILGGHKYRPKQGLDQCKFVVGDSSIVALPLGTGEKIRGYRGNIVIADEFSCLDKNTLIETNNGLERIGDMCDIKTKIINKDGKMESIDRFIKTPKTDVYEITTKYGYSFKCSNIHKVLTLNGWKLAKDLTTQDSIIMDNQYVFPQKIPYEWLTKDTAYLLGLLISEGNIKNKYHVGVRNTDIELLRRVEKIFLSLNLKPYIYTQDAYIDKRGWKCKKSYELRVHNIEFRDKLFSAGLDYVGSKDKKIPSCILKSPKEIVVSFLSGLFEGDGSCFVWNNRNKPKLGVSYYSASETLAQDVQTVLYKLNIVSYRTYRKSLLSKNKQWMVRCNGVHALNLCNLLQNKKYEKTISRTHTYERSKDYGVTFDKSRNKYIVNFSYCGQIYRLGRYKSKQEARRVVKDFLKTNKTFMRVRSVDKLDYKDNLYDLYLPKTHSFYGNGFVQHNSIPPEIFDIVVRGFAATTKSPMEEARRLAAYKKLKELDMAENLIQKLVDEKPAGNQIVYSGTAYYAFNHFAKRYEMWKKIIKTKGDRNKIAEIFGSELNIPDNFNWEDYAIIRLPYTHVQEGLLDMKQLSHAKAILPDSVFQMEYCACVLPDTRIDVLGGSKKITDIQIGDYVLTHKNRWKRVTKKTFRKYNGIICTLKAGRNDPISITIDHPIFTNNDFREAGKLRLRDSLKMPLYKFKDTHTIDMHENTHDFNTHIVNGIEYVFPRWSSSKSKIIKTTIADKKHKSDIPRYIPLDRSLGFILGLYAGDGHINKKNTQICITFNATQQDRANELIDAVKRVFGLNCTCRHGKTNGYSILTIYINSRMVCDLFEKLIGKGCREKYITIEKDLTKDAAIGFIRGYWLSDGYDHEVIKGNPHLDSVNHSLLSFTKRILLNLGCLSHFYHRNPKCSKIKDGRIINGGESWLLMIDYKFFDIFKDIINYNVRSGSNNDIYIEPKQYSEHQYSGYVYNLEVEEDHSYFGGGIINHNCFISDSNGFFKRSLIESCTTKPDKPIETPDGQVTFSPLMSGKSKHTYIMGVDPAAEVDNFAVVISEILQNHMRVVYCWSVNKDEFKKRKESGLVTDDDYYAYCCHKIRSLVKKFNISRIEMDSQGGGYAISEMLRNKALLKGGEFPIYEIIEHDHPKDADGYNDGPHIINLVKATTEWNTDSNLFMHKSFETKQLLFPSFNPIKMNAALIIEKSLNVTFDTYEDCVNEIEKLKDEICMIQITETSTGKVRFETQKILDTGNSERKYSKGRLRKDRYSALLLSHRYYYDTSTQIESSIDYNDVAGNISKVKSDPSEGMYKGPGLSQMKNHQEYNKAFDVFGAIKDGKRIE